MDDMPLFRTAAINAKQVRWLGNIVIVRPFSFFMFTTASFVISLLILCLLFFGSYTKRSTVQGQLAPHTGVIKIFAPQPGIILAKYVNEGQQLKKGDILFVISSERNNRGNDGIQAAISRQVAIRQQSLRDELSLLKSTQEAEQAAHRENLLGLQEEQSNLRHQLLSQRSRIELAEAGMKRYAELLSQGYVSAEMAQQRQVEVLDQRNRLQVLDRDRIRVERELQAQHNDLANLSARQANQAAQIERLLASTSQEWIESEGIRITTVTASESGTATATLAEVGQTVDGNKPLVSILPVNAVLQAHLYAPSRTIGFIRPGDPVRLRYQAFPYQKFGHAEGIVSSVTKVGLLRSDVAEIPALVPSGEQLYRITVSLARQNISAYEHAYNLKSGMTLEADILQERRTLFEWVFEPLYSIKGKV